MSGFLRWIGITNAAIWFGAAVGWVVVIGPAFSSPEMLKVLPRSHAGAAAQVVVERLWLLQCWCGAIALGHLLMESLYAGKPLHRWVNYLVLGLAGIALVTGLWLEPKLKRLHLEQYGMRSTPQQRSAAAESVRVWQEVGQLARWLGVIGLGFYLAELSGASGGIRFAAAKLRG